MILRKTKPIVGLKITHDAAMAIVNGNTLIASVEFEKVNNNPRYTRLPSWEAFHDQLKHFGVDDFDLVVDGWRDGSANAGGTVGEMKVAPYHEFNGGKGNPFLPYVHFKTGSGHHYSSFPHMTGHIIGTYALSPFSRSKQRVISLSFDGRQPPRIHYLNPKANDDAVFSPAKEVFTFSGWIYSIMGYYFGPFKSDEIMKEKRTDWGPLFGEREWPGKLMAYIAKGKPDLLLYRFASELYDEMNRNHQTTFSSYREAMDLARNAGNFEHRWLRKVKGAAKKHMISDEAVLATIHQFLSDRLVEGVIYITEPGQPLIISGGSALNIKWNSALRDSGHFSDVFVSPAPNDAGSALGQAASLAAWRDEIWALSWSVYSGPDLSPSAPPRGWTETGMTPEGLGKRLATSPEEPIVVLYGRAELGPRALGHRSILAAATEPGMKRRLNEVKKREYYRPVAPICLEGLAPEWFTPGTPDPYMLFEHRVRPEVRNVVPAIVHLDNSARLQTISSADCSIIANVLRSYYEVTDVPLLANTSANFPGKGFFPDVRSACEWAESVGLTAVWANGTLYEIDGED